MRSSLRRLGELGAGAVLAPERWTAAESGVDGVPLGELVIERRERADGRSVVLDTTHARDGILDVAAALRGAGEARSTKKRAHAGDLVVSRLRPYLRQIAYVHPRVLVATDDRPLALSTEFYVLAPRRPADDVAFLLPFLLGDAAQAVLASAQEGGHHPRVPRESLLALRVPHELVEDRRRSSKRVNEALDAMYRAMERWERLKL